MGNDAVTFRYLEPGEGRLLSEAIRVAYGETYDVPWVYDPSEVEARLKAARTTGDVLRMQSLHRARINADDISVASDHGHELLDYVLADLR